MNIVDHGFKNTSVCVNMEIPLKTKMTQILLHVLCVASLLLIPFFRYTLVLKNKNYPGGIYFCIP